MNDERTELQAEVEQLVDDRQRWQRPTLKRLQVNLDTALGGAVKLNDATTGFDTSG